MKPRMSLATVAFAALIGAGTVGGATHPGTVDLLTQANVRIDGLAPFDNLGQSVAGVGDVNGDGRGDIAIGVPGADNNNRPLSGSAYVIFGSASAATIDIAALGAGGFRIDGALIGHQAGMAVANAGDMNGDGRPELAVAVPGAGNNARDRSGSVYVIFGSTDTTNVDLATLGSRGFRIDGAAAGASLGEPPSRVGSVLAGVGDMNGDGLADLAIGVRGANNTGLSASGSTYVVYGSAAPANIDLATLGAAGVRIDGAAAQEQSGGAVAGLGDVNGDGRPDLGIGATFAGNNARPESGSTYVVFGGALPATINLATLGAAGFRIDGAQQFHRAGVSVGRPGDINGDGLADVALGANLVPAPGRGAAGAAYVVYGARNSAAVDLATLGARGVRLLGAEGGTSTGLPVAGIGDLNGDGRGELAVGARFSNNNGRPGSGSVHVVSGGVSADIDLATLGAAGFRVDGAAAGDAIGNSIGSAGDFNGDGRNDLVIGASGANPAGGENAGSAYIVFGFGAPSLTYPPITATVGSALVPVPAVVSQRAASIFAAVGLPSGLTVDPATGTIQGTPNSSGRSRATVSLADLGGSVQATVEVRVRRCVVIRRGTNQGDTILGTARTESLVGRGGNDFLFGGDNEDCIDGGAGDDSVYGGAGADLLGGGPGRDTIVGGGGDDTINGGPGRDGIVAGAGNDRVDSRDGAREIVKCGPGADVARIDRVDVVRGCEQVRRR